MNLENQSQSVVEKDFRILCLDGGGSKGTYSLGFLQQVEALLGSPLYQNFDAIYGTSTGAIIAAMIGIGIPISEVYKTYLMHIPGIMECWFASGKSNALNILTSEAFGERTFEDFKTFVGIVATNWTLERPFIFKSSVDASYGSKATFKPGFGCTIAEAVRASSAATPFFKRVFVNTENQGKVETADGGFFANNPTLLALTDAVGSFKIPTARIKVLSVGCGKFPERKRNLLIRLLKRTPTARLLQKVLSTNSITIEHQCKFLFPQVEQLRVNESYETPDLATDFLEADSRKLELLYQRGRQSFESAEEKVKALMGC
ncbi:MAG TPA: patatin-like phospholipase family protein [Chthoniobacteraceae bacterium]|jgi:patatin-like phospholipase/acyl hydrolase|nr:patatin-like phospholipase family protein [Chthoniobacteraceae bacterium]